MPVQQNLWFIYAASYGFIEDRDCWKQPAAWAHKTVSNLMNYTCVGVLTCLLVYQDKRTGMTHPSSWMSGKSKKVEVIGRAFFLFPHFQLGRVIRWLCKQGKSRLLSFTITVAITLTMWCNNSRIEKPQQEEASNQADDAVLTGFRVLLLK